MTKTQERNTGVNFCTIFNNSINYIQFVLKKNKKQTTSQQHLLVKFTHSVQITKYF